MDIVELKSTHKDYQSMVNQWQVYNAAYNGTQALIDLGVVLNKHERESKENHKRRKDKAFGYNFTKRLINLINSLLSQKKPTNDYGKLKNNELFSMFLNNCNYEGTSFEKWLLEQQLSSLILGHTGVLIDKPQIEIDKNRTELDEINQEIYPYLSSFSALNILDWDYERVNGKPVLTYIKLVDDCCNYRLWWQDKWEVWEIKEDELYLSSKGVNQLGIVPFLWLINEESGMRYIGVSLAAEVSAIDISIIENLSQGEEVIDLSAFPMIRKPKLMPGENDDDVVGTSGVLEFDAKYPESKPDWLASEAKQPIDAILEWIDSKVVEMARMFNASAFFSQSKAAISGESRKREFQLMNSVLAAESQTLEVFQKNIIYYWLLWHGKPELINDVVISRPNDFDISDKTEELDALTIAKSTVNSTKFQQEVDKKMAKLVLPDMPIKVAGVVVNEIETQRDVPEVEADAS